MCVQACRRHGTAPTASAALGRALIGTLLMGSFKEEGERTQVTFKGNGSLGSMQVKHARIAIAGCHQCGRMFYARIHHVVQVP